MKKLFTILFLCSSIIASATDYYVAKNGSNSNPGTITEPFLTITYAITRMSGGDNCYIRAGTYNEHPIIDYISGTVENPTIFTAYNDEEVIIDGGGISIPDGSGLIRVRDNDVHLMGLIVQNTNHVGISAAADAYNLLISHCVVREIQGGGIGAFGDNTIIENVTAYNCAMSNEGGTSSPWGQGITIRTSNTDVSLNGGVIRNCVVHDVWGEGVSMSGIAGGTIEDCTIYNTYSVALYVRNSQNCVLQRNYVYMAKDMAGGQSRGIAHWNEAGMEWFPNLDNQIINNIVFGCRRNFQTASTTTGLLVANNTFVNSTYIGNVCLGDYEYNSMEFKNNIVIQENSAPCVYWLYDDADVIFSNNLYNKSYNAYAVGSNDVISSISIKRDGDEYQYKFYELFSNSPAVDGGCEVTEVTDDYLSVERDATLDIGAFEYVSPETPVLPVVILTTSVQIITNYALVSGNVVDDGGGTVTVRGVCWAEDELPTINSDTTINGSGIGAYTAILRILDAGVTYYARAYAINEQGVSYGETVVFTMPLHTDNKYVFYNDKLVFRDGLPLMSSSESPPPPIDIDILVTDINVAGAEGATTITIEDGTLQIYADVEPDNAADTAVVWSRTNRTGTGYIDTNGLLTAQSDGIVTIRATAHDGSGIYDTLQITISNQDPPPLETQIIIDHTSVALYDDIPDFYIAEVKKMRGLIAGLSHASGYLDGLKQLEINDSKYQVALQYTGSVPLSYRTTELRIGKNIWNAFTSTWISGYEEDQWTNGTTNINNTKTGIAFTNNGGWDLDAMGFGWCYDYLELTAEVYLSATQTYIDYCTSQGFDTKVFFTTGPVDSYWEDGPTTSHVSCFWYATLWQDIRDYVEADEDLILFDYADILCYNDSDELRELTYSGNTFPWIHPDNMGGGMTDGHIGYNGAVRLAKAMWVLMARIAGWDGN
jgi:hypothetical protein